MVIGISLQHKIKGCLHSMTPFKKTMHQSPYHPFAHDLGIKIIKSNIPTDQATICCHGYGASNTIVNVMHSYKTLPGHLVGFNFPDYGITPAIDHSASTFGSIDEVLPLLFVIKECLNTLDVKIINLYGFSAGGGAIINALAILNNNYYTYELERIGILQEQKAAMIHAIEQGHVILDCPLKSIEEIIAFRGKDPMLEALKQNFDSYGTNPIDSLPKLTGLNLNMFIHFQNPDEIIFNRDDALFIERLQKAHAGKTFAIIGNEGGHNCYHASLWNFYKDMHEKHSSK